MRRAIGLLQRAVLALCLICLLAGAPGCRWALLRLAGPVVAPTATSTPAVVPTVAPSTAQVLANTVVPARDSRALAARLRPAVGSIPDVVNPQAPQYVAGDRATFWVHNSDSQEVFQVTATLRLISRHATIWVQDGVSIDQERIERAARNFDERIYPTVHRYFGSEWTPGVDSDPRVAILSARFSGAAGYYSSSDQFSRRVNPYSNEREMLYMSLDSARPGSQQYEAILAHEFQHMVHWHLDSNEDAWVSEGASELASRVCGYGASGAIYAFGLQPDTQLTGWALSPDEDTLPHYGASYLWMDYFLQRQGPEALKTVVAEPLNGIDAFERVLGQTSGAPAFDELFADWVVANALDDASLAGGRYGHEHADPRMIMESTHRSFPVQHSGTVSQYGTDYISLVPRAEALKVEFSGSQKAPVVPNSALQGRYQWWSNRGDMSNTTLTRPLDLTRVKRATLEYALWYELEDGWDYGYLEVSTDNGATWTPLATSHTTTYNPNGNAFGPGYTGASGQPPGSKTRLVPQWVREQVDLTPYAGQRVLVRFELITDDAVNLPGLCIDDISVREVGFKDDAEREVAGWQAEGFVRIDNELPQKFLVQVIEQGKETRVRRMALDSEQRGALVLGDAERAVLAISGLTRYTTEPVPYTYSVSSQAREP